MEVGNWVIWERFAPVLRGLGEKSKDFRTAKEAFCARLNGEYFLKCANVGYPLTSRTDTQLKAVNSEGRVISCTRL